jgi:hypothetical protein
MAMFKSCQASKDIHSKYSQWPNGRLPYGDITPKNGYLKLHLENFFLTNFAMPFKW